MNKNWQMYWKAQSDPNATQTSKRVERHFELLKKWNGRANLVSKSSLPEALSVHYLDSLLLADFLAKRFQNVRIADVGTGAGFPGFLFALRYPGWSIDLYEAKEDKRSFLNICLAELELTNMSINAEAPSFIPCDILVSRAFLPPIEWFQFARQRVDSGTSVLLSCTSAVSRETVEGFHKLGSFDYELGKNLGIRRAILFEKM